MAAKKYSRVPTIPDWVPSNSGRPSAEELNLLTAPRVQVAAANRAIPLVYGRDRLPGRIFFLSVDDENGFLYLGMLFCEGPVDAIESILVDGKPVDAEGGLLSHAGAAVTAHLGLSTDPPDGLLAEGASFASSNQPYTDTLPGTVYIALKVPKKASSGFPRVEAIIRGLKVYDPRKDSTAGGSGSHRRDNPATWEFSQNPTLCFADFAAVRVGWPVEWGSVVDNANANDEVLDNGKPRRQIGLSMLAPATAQGWVQGFRTYMGAFVSWEGGKMRIIPERADADAPYGLHLNQDRDASPYDYVTAAHLAGQGFGTGSFVVSAQVRFDRADANQVMASKYSSGSVAGFYFRINTSGALQLWVSDGTTATSVGSSVPIPDLDEDLHEYSVHVDRAAGTVVFKVDGLQLGAIRSWPSTVTGNITGTGPLRLGGLNTTSNSLFGILDEVRLWNRLVTPEEEAFGLNNEFSQPPQGLVGYYKLNSLDGQVAIDSSANANHGTVVGSPVWVLGNPQVVPAGVAYHFTSDHIKRGGLRLRHRSSRNAPNSIMVEYLDSSYPERWRTMRVQVDAPKVTAGQQGRRVSQISLPGIHDAAQAYREAVERLNWFISDLEGQLSVFDEGLNVQNGSVIAVTHPMGLNAKLFRVRRVQGGRGDWHFDIAEYDPAAYSDEIIATPTIPDTNLGNPLVPPTVAGLSAVEELFRYKNGNTGSRVRATWNSSNYAFLSGYVVEGYVNGVRVFQSTSLLNEAVTPPVEELVGDEPVVYEIRVAVQTPFAVGEYTTVSVEVLGKLAPPSNVPSLTLTQIKSDQVELHWDEAEDIDIWRYEVRVGGPGSTWETASTLELVDGLNYIATSIPVGEHHFYLKARDSVGNESPEAIVRSLTIGAPPAVTTFTGFEVGGEVRLSWTPPINSPYIARYRITYADVPQTFERTLDVVDTLTFVTGEVPEGTFDFRVYSLDDANRESASAPVRRISVTSDQDAFLVDSYDFANPVTVTNMASWTLRTSPTRYWVTNMGGAFLSNPSSFQTYANNSLANYHTSGSSLWLSETYDFGLPLTGNWVLESDLEVLGGSATTRLELSLNGTTWQNHTGSPPVAAKGEYRYARVRVSTTGSSTVLVKSPGMNLSVKVVPLEESGRATTSVSGPSTVVLSRPYAAVKEIVATPINAIEPMSAVPDNIQVGGSGNSSFDLYVFDRFGQQIAADVQYKFKGV